jgi:hypothetical protein
MPSTEKPSPAPMMTVTRSPYWRVVYCNTLGLGWGETEVRLNIGFDQDLGKPGSNILEESVVAMPHRAAKMLAFTLNSVIANWEAINGPIPLPVDKIQEIERQVNAQAPKPPAE